MQNGFAARLKSLRKEKSLTQTELGNLAGLHYQHIGRYERGESQPSAAAIKRLAEVLSVSVDFLVSGNNGSQAHCEQLDDQELLQQFRDVEKLPQEDKIVVKKLLDAFLTKKKIQSLVAS